MEGNTKDILRSILDFFAILVPGVLVYAVLLYRVPELLKKFSPSSVSKSRIQDSAPSGEAASADKRDLNILFVILQVYVLGYIVFGFSGIFDLAPPLNKIPMLSNIIMRQEGLLAYNELHDEFKTNGPPQWKLLGTLKSGSDDDLSDIAMAYVRLRDQDLAHDLEALHTEFRTCRSLTFFCAAIAFSAIVFKTKFVPGWRWLTFWMVIVSLFFFSKYSQRKIEFNKETFRYATLLKATPDRSQPNSAKEKTEGKIIATPR